VWTPIKPAPLHARIEQAAVPSSGAFDRSQAEEISLKEIACRGKAPTPAVAAPSTNYHRMHFRRRRSKIVPSKLWNAAPGWASTPDAARRHSGYKPAFSPPACAISAAYHRQEIAPRIAISVLIQPAQNPSRPVIARGQRIGPARRGTCRHITTGENLLLGSLNRAPVKAREVASAHLPCATRGVPYEIHIVWPCLSPRWLLLPPDLPRSRPPAFLRFPARSPIPGPSLP